MNVLRARSALCVCWCVFMCGGTGVYLSAAVVFMCFCVFTGYVVLACFAVCEHTRLGECT
eukprot:EC713617.1.p5 GENE.EC713617.1~~EC713617.1.p5  ORF type:complete len:60 (+),score=7.48 EC713617.1:63-242(+)